MAHKIDIPEHGSETTTARQYGLKWPDGSVQWAEMDGELALNVGADPQFPNDSTGWLKFQLDPEESPIPQRTLASLGRRRMAALQAFKLLTEAQMIHPALITRQVIVAVTPAVEVSA